MRRSTVLALVVIGMVGLAGCVGGSGEPDPAPSTDAPGGPASFSDQTGAIEGIVTDTELTPLPGAQLQLLDTEFTATSDANGGFTFSNLPPQQYRLAATKLGYEAAAQRVTVQAGAVTSDVKLILPALAAESPRTVVYEFKGFITCSIGFAGVISEECGQGLQTSVGTFGRDPNNNIDWVFKLENQTDVEELQNIFLEMSWRPASAAANQLGFHVAHGFTCTPSCGEKLAYCDVFDNHGAPVQKCDITAESLGIKNPATELPWDITARAWAAPVEPTEVPNIVLQQPVQMFRTEFYVEPMPEGYSAVPDA